MVVVKTTERHRTTSRIKRGFSLAKSKSILATLEGMQRPHRHYFLVFRLSTKSTLDFTIIQK